MIKITLPKKHEDGFTIKYWEVSLSETWVFLAEMKAVYYLNTKWDSYSKEKGGADLIDDWMFAKKEVGSNHWHGEGRCLGWSLVHKLPLFRQITEFMDRFMLCAENHSATTLGLGRILKRSGNIDDNSV